jgi:hypothetical protein
MLDVARETYKENTHDIMQCESLRDDQTDDRHRTFEGLADECEIIVG